MRQARVLLVGERISQYLYAIGAYAAVSAERQGRHLVISVAGKQLRLESAGVSVP